MEENNILKAVINARIVTTEGIVRGYVLYRDGRILETGPGAPGSFSELVEVFNAGGLYVGPGFVNIHCHAAGNQAGSENPVAFAAHHLKSGTTSLVCSIYQSEGYEKTLAGIKRLRRWIESGIPGNLIGIHLEGPYLNPKYGVNPKTARSVQPEEYEKFIDAAGGWIRHWTYAPEVPGTEVFADALTRHGIVPAIGHTEASPEQIFEACDRGARIFTHLFNAAGSSVDPTRFAGTVEVRADEAAMLRDEIYCEVIPDARGVHVRPLKIRLIAKTIGISRLLAVTDTFVGQDEKPAYPPDDIRSAGDCNFIDGALAGNSMTMLMAFRNIKNHAGLTVPEAFRVCSKNPADAIGIGDRTGSIEPGKRADFVFLNDNLDLKRVVLGGEDIREGEYK